MKYLPYLLLEIVLPGGTLLAAGLWVYRNRKEILLAMSNRLPLVRLLGNSEEI